jgi:hypothetical protein
MICGTWIWPEAEEFLRRINRLSIEMTHRRRKRQTQKQRKRILRGMKKLVKVVGRHGRRRRELLDKNWEKTDWTRPQAEQVLRRIDGLLELLPKAQKQAHERIIGGRQADNAQKILSLYEPDIHVLVRGKAGAEVEFGNTLLLGENKQGIILDYQTWKGSAPADVHLLVQSLERVVVGLDRKVSAVGADRGFASKANTIGLKEADIFNGICPRSPEELKERMKDKRFVRMQKRRSQTEARISILQRGFLGRPMRAKGMAHRELAVSWGILTQQPLEVCAPQKQQGRTATPSGVAGLRGLNRRKKQKWCRHNFEIKEFVRSEMCITHWRPPRP